MIKEPGVAKTFPAVPAGLPRMLSAADGEVDAIWSIPEPVSQFPYLWCSKNR
jgi:hypothetical protein